MISPRFGLAWASLIALGAVVASCGDDESVAPAPCKGAACGFTGLSAPLTVRRDDNGMVHVHGKTDADVFFGSGYAQATDRLFQMELIRRRALGRSAEVFGPDRVGDDKLVRTLDMARRGRENVELAKAEVPELQVLAEAWTAGVNRYVDEVLSGERALPAGFAEQGIQPERWDVGDGYAVGKLLLFGNANQIEFDVLSTALQRFQPTILEKIPLLSPLFLTFHSEVDSPALDPDRWSGDPHIDGEGSQRSLPADAPERIRRWSSMMSRFRPPASNNWAVEASASATGRPMIAGDPHQGLSSPTIFWAHHMNSADAGGTIDVVGWSFVGTPGVQLGHNRKIAWTATTNYPDTMDLYDVPQPGADVVEVGGQPVTMVARDEMIFAKGVAEPEVYTVWEVPGHGVLLPGELLPLPLVDEGHALMLAWVGLKPTREGSAFVGLDTAQSLDDFERAVDGMELGCFNFLAASAEGISYRSSPSVPDRGAPTVGRDWPYMMMDGSDPANLWTGALLPPEKLPRSRGGGGFIATANNDPFGFTQDGAIEGDPWYFGVYFDPGARETRVVQRLQQAIDETGAVSLDEMKDIQRDVRSLLAVELVPLVEEAWGEPATGEEAEAIRGREDVARLVDLIAGWDRGMARHQVAPVPFNALAYFITRQAIADDFGIFFSPIAEQEPIYLLKFGLLALRHQDGGALADGRQLTILRGLAETADWMMERYDSVDEGFTWGEVHGSTFSSVGPPSLDRGWFSTDGGDGTVNVATARFFGGEDGTRERLESTGGAIYRMVAEIGADGVPRAEFNMPLGMSGDPHSPHWNDLHQDWIDGVYRPLRFLEADVAANTVESATIEP